MKRTRLLRRSRINAVSTRRRKRSGKPGKLGIVRLYGPNLEALRRERYELDGHKCVDCKRWLRFESGYQDSMHMAHAGNKRMYGDVIGNVRSKCGDCHLVKEHNPKSVPPKPTKEEAA